MSGLVIAGAIVAGVGALGSVLSGKSSRRQQQRAQRAQEVLAQQQLRQQRLGQLRQSQMARAQVTQASVSTGTAESSGLGGALAGIGSTTASNISFANQAFRLRQDINTFNRRAETRRMNEALYGQVFQVGMQMMSYGQGGGQEAPGAAMTQNSNTGGNATGQFGVQSGGWGFS